MIYEPFLADDYECLNLRDGRDYETFNAFNGEPRAATWVPIRVRRVRPDKKMGFKASDFPWLCEHVLVFRERARDALRDVLDAHGETLPLATSDGVALFAFNARVVDALDEPRSDIVRFPSSGRIMSLRKPAFVGERIEGLDMFRTTMRRSPTYLSDRFVARVAAHGLVGLTFKPVWPWE